MLPEPGSQGWENMVDFMRADLDSDMAYTKIEITARKILKEEGRDFNEEFKKWRIEKNKPVYDMKVKCSWCGLDMGIKPCDKGQQDKISHSICKSCKIEIEKEIT